MYTLTFAIRIKHVFGAHLNAAVRDDYYEKHRNKKPATLPIRQSQGNITMLACIILCTSEKHECLSAALEPLVNQRYNCFLLLQHLHENDLTDAGGWLTMSKVFLDP